MNKKTVSITLLLIVIAIGLFHFTGFGSYRPAGFMNDDQTPGECAARQIPGGPDDIEPILLDRYFGDISPAKKSLSSYAKKVTARMSHISAKKLFKTSPVATTCVQAKLRIMAEMLKRHPMAEHVSFKGSTISYFDNEEKTWITLLLNPDTK
jgi:hypothetical protein